MFEDGYTRWIPLKSFRAIWAAGAIRNLPYCTDLILPVGPVETWRVVSGRATITLSPPRSRAREAAFYQATVHIVDAKFISAIGARIRLPSPVTLIAMVGMVMG